MSSHDDRQASRRTERFTGSPEQEFHLGVEAAAMAVLHPSLSRDRPADWLGRQTIPFQQGYLVASAELATAITLHAPPLRIHLPRISASLRTS
jgi:hypothetical protein